MSRRNLEARETTLCDAHDQRRRRLGIMTRREARNRPHGRSACLEALNKMSIGASDAMPTLGDMACASADWSSMADDST